MQINFDLFIIHTWDGNPNSDPGSSPDEWRASIVGGGTLLHTTFSNFPDPSHPILGPYAYQAFPGTYPGAQAPGQTGAIETDSLGFVEPLHQSIRSIDSVYRLSFLVPSSETSINFRFEGLMNDYGVGTSIAHESWGLDNVVVSAVTIPEPGSALLMLVGAIVGTAFPRRRR